MSLMRQASEDATKRTEQDADTVSRASRVGFYAFGSCIGGFLVAMFFPYFLASSVCSERVSGLLFLLSETMAFVLGMISRNSVAGRAALILSALALIWLLSQLPAWSHQGLF